MKTLEIFDVAFCINLDRRTDRWAETVEELSRWGIGTVNRYSAFDHPTSGHEGCSRSHRDLMRTIADGSCDRVLILEDDVAAVTKSRLKLAGFKETQEVWQTHCSLLNGEGNVAQRFAVISDHIPNDWDVLYLGGGYQEPPLHRVNRHVIRCAGMLTTSSIGVTREFARKFTEAADKATNGDRDAWIGPIDLFYSGLSRANVFYCLQPRLIFQRKSKSDITGQEFSYLFSMTDPTHENLC